MSEAALDSFANLNSPRRARFLRTAVALVSGLFHRARDCLSEKAQSVCLGDLLVRLQAIKPAGFLRCFVAMYSPAHTNDVRSGMKPDQSKRLKIGQRVAWHDSETDQGTVTASDWSGVRITWDSGLDQFFHHNNMTEVEVARTNLQ